MAGTSHGFQSQGVHGTWSLSRQNYTLSESEAIFDTQSVQRVSHIVDPSVEDYSIYCTTDVQIGKSQGGNM